MNETKETKKKKEPTFWDKLWDQRYRIAAVTVAGILGYIGIKKLIKTGSEIVADIPEFEFDHHDSVPVPDKLKGIGVDNIDMYSGCYEFMTGYVGSDGEYPAKVADIDKIKDVLVNDLPGVDEDSSIYMLVNVSRKAIDNDD